MRVLFQYSDDNYLYVLPIDAASPHEGDVLRVRYNLPQVNDAFTASCRMLWRDAALNLLNVTTDAAGTLLPAFIIIEPDYLIDISSLAECFKEYGHHPANYLLSRLQIAAHTRQILLGNIANLFLDEWVNATTPPDYLTCMHKAFQVYPLELAACADLQDKALERAFFAECRQHFEHIRRTVTETFGDAGYHLDRTDAVLEPSYICEALGLQGRLDYMQRDMSAFIEMKSGKADEYQRRGHIMPRENNAVQMLLYLAVLEYSMNMPHRQVKAYLLYTRYPLLYPATPSWQKLQEVMEIRNRIVADEHAVQRNNRPDFTAAQLRLVAPDVLNERHLTGVLWKQYLHPAINAIGKQIQALTPLEQRYFYTLYTFITKELYYAKTDIHPNREAPDEGEELLCGLVIRENHAADLSKPYLLLERTDHSRSLPNFRKGDAVVLYQRNKETDRASNQLVFKGNIEMLSDRQLRIRLRATQRNRFILPADSRYAIEHDRMDTTFRSMYQGLALFLNANPSRRDLLLAQRMPISDPSYTARISAATDDFERISLKVQAADDYFLLVGPPGTGKTSRALRRMVEDLHRERKQLLLLSYTNRAVDEICKTLSAITPVVDYIRVGSELPCDPAYHAHLIENVLRPYTTRREVQERLARCRIFVGTIATLSGKSELFQLKRFDVAIVDEATQILEPQLLGLLCMRHPTGCDAIGKFVLIGDHKQLPAVVLQTEEESQVTDDDLRSIGLYNLKDSLFERLYRRTTESAFDMLCRQGRMNEEVAQFPNRAFYEGKLLPVGLPHQYGCLALVPELTGSEFARLLTRRVAFIPSQPDDSARSIKVNHFEAALAARLAAAIYQQYRVADTFSPDRTLGIITPYRSQIALIRSELAAFRLPELDAISIDTVERFQGSERDVIIYSFCVNKAEQLKFIVNLMEENGALIDRKLNVVLTRARKQIFLTGAPQLLRQNSIFERLISQITEGISAIFPN
ncbi:MAG: AAA family ATPase [Prevotellaceae bacterium]|nr:AAA family ATPase [Prevotellaceae bacterium]